MNSLLRKLIVPVGAAVMAGTGFAYLSGGTSSASYASQATSTIGSYKTYNVRYGVETLGQVGYVSFDAVPADGSHDGQADASTAMVQFVNGSANPWVACQRSVSLGGADSLNRNFLDTVVNGDVVQVGSPESHWVCDVRAANVPATTSLTGLNIQILH